MPKLLEIEILELLGLQEGTLLTNDKLWSRLDLSRDDYTDEDKNLDAWLNKIKIISKILELDQLNKKNHKR